MMTTDKANGCDSLWFYAGSYGKDTGVKMSVSYSVNGGETWTKIGSTIAVGEMKRYAYKINRDGNIRLKFESENTGNKRVNIDNVQMSDWEDPTGIDNWTIIQSDNCGIVNSSDCQIYDLSGRKVEHPRKGIYIVKSKNGRWSTVNVQ